MTSGKGGSAAGSFRTQDAVLSWSLQNAFIAFVLIDIVVYEERETWPAGFYCLAVWFLGFSGSGFAGVGVSVAFGCWRTAEGLWSFVGVLGIGRYRHDRWVHVFL